MLPEHVLEKLRRAPLSSVLESYYAVRAKRDAYKRQMEQQSLIMEDIATIGIDRLQQEEGQGIRTKSGLSGYLSERRSVSVSDPHVFREWIEIFGRHDLLENRVGLSDMETYMAENNGQLPPGVKYTRTTTFNVRKS